MAWHRVAARLSSTVGELKQRLSYSEFLDWLEFLKWEDNQQTKQDVYLALIAREIRRSYVKHPNTVKIESFLLNTPSLPPATQKQKDKAAESKRIWLACLNIKEKK